MPPPLGGMYQIKAGIDNLLDKKISVADHQCYECANRKFKTEK